MVLASPTLPFRTPAFEAVIWDYDGTLVASRCADEHAVDVLLQLHPEAASGVDRFWATEGRPIEERVEMAWPGYLGDYLPLFEAPYKPDVFRGVSSTLRTLERHGLRMGVVSSRRRQALLWGLEATGLLRHFPVVVGLDDVSEPKPSPEGLQLALTTLEVRPNRAIFIGDSEVDVLAARAAGMTVWRATWCAPPGPGEAPARRVTSPRKVLDLIEPFDSAIDLRD